MIVASYVRDAGVDTYCVLDTTALLGFWKKVHQWNKNPASGSPSGGRPILVIKFVEPTVSIVAHSFYSYLVAWWFVVAIDTLQQYRLLRLLRLHLHHNAVLIGRLFGSVHNNALHINLHLHTLENGKKDKHLQGIDLWQHRQYFSWSKNCLQELTSPACQNVRRATCPSCTGSRARCPGWPGGEGWWLWSRSARLCYRLAEQRTRRNCTHCQCSTTMSTSHNNSRPLFNFFLRNGKVHEIFN